MKASLSNSGFLIDAFIFLHSQRLAGTPRQLQHRPRLVSRRRRASIFAAKGAEADLRHYLPLVRDGPTAAIYGLWSGI